MAKYKVLMHPNNGNDCYVMDGEFTTVDEAVRSGMAFGTDDFWVVVKQEWKAQPTESEEVK